jgi:hypothetical protein
LTRVVEKVGRIRLREEKMWTTIQGVLQNSRAPGWFFYVEFQEEL